MKKMYKATKGITLVALVVTIVVLLILATVTLGMTMSNNWIFGKAKNATDTYKQVAANESSLLNNVDDSIEDALHGSISQIEKYKNSQEVVSTTQNTGLKDDNENIVTVPIGFKIASDSATKQEDGIVIEDKDGNQYVWIPVANIANYKRTDFGKQNENYSNYSETISSDEQTSVSTYHGYYIGRYESGDSISTNNKTLRTSGASVTNKVSIKKGQAPYNFVTRDQSKTLAIGLKVAEGYSAITKLCSSYAWDTAINFIQNKILNYATSSSQGNYTDTTFNYTDITGLIKTKSINSNILVPTAQNIPINSIYDMCGNEWEWTTEISSVSGCLCVLRGGCFIDNYLTNPSGFRGAATTSDSSEFLSFRITLYM